jgi:hypothetical protein
MVDKSALRSRLFRHLDGLATAHVAIGLRNRGVLDAFLAQRTVSLEELSRQFRANDGYLNVAMRTLASQGWLEFRTDNHSDQVQYTTNERTAAAVDLLPWYEPVIAFSRRAEAYQPNILHPELLGELGALLDRYASGWSPALSAETGPLAEQVLIHIEGNLLAPILVKLAMDGVLQGDMLGKDIRAEDVPHYSAQLRTVLEFFVRIGWAVARNGAYRLTPTGEFFATKASAYGVIVSYLPTFRRVDELIFGDPEALKHVAFGDDEQHVDRVMNVWGSGGAHSTYFKAVDDIFLELFNRPIEQQPKGILDMGCGNGAFLRHLHQTIGGRTLRGRVLRQHPLLLIGADYNRSALDVTRKNLADWRVPAEVTWGDIGQPDVLARDVRSKCGVRLDDLLNVRTFLDHNRIWEVPPPKHYRRASSSSGAFSYRGARVSNNDLEVNLYHYLKKWSPHVQTFGLLMIELHTIPPELAAAHIGATVATAYDTAHGFSDQYIVEIDVLQRIAADAGLVSDTNVFRRFPDSELATVSINLFHGSDRAPSRTASHTEAMTTV